MDCAKEEQRSDEERSSKPENFEHCSHRRKSILHYMSPSKHGRSCELFTDALLRLKQDGFQIDEATSLLQLCQDRTTEDQWILSNPSLDMTPINL